MDGTEIFRRKMRPGMMPETTKKRKDTSLKKVKQMEL
jgi:hypothetical protein